MNFRLAIIYVASKFSVALATGGDILNRINFAAASESGNKLLSKAQLVDGRRLDDEDFTWIADYSIKFKKCYSFYHYAIEGEGGNEGNGDDDNMANFYHQQLVTFDLCPSNSCSSKSSGTCSGGGQYVVGMLDFADAYTESKLNQQEYNCEQIREGCYCYDDVDDEVCEAQCYEDAGLDYCGEEENDDDRFEEFNLQEYLECREMEVNNNNNNNGNGYQYYIGPKCADNGNSVTLGVFTDANCLYEADDGTYENFNYGRSLPYSSESLIDDGCISCLEPNDEDDDAGDVEVTEFCDQMYEGSGKCESSVSGLYYPKTGGCDYINNVLPGILQVYSGSSIVGSSIQSRLDQAKELTGQSTLTLFLGFTTVLLAILSCVLHSRVSKAARPAGLAEQGIV